MGEYVNSKQVRFDKSFVSCGVLEAHHLPHQQPSQSAFSTVNALYHKANPRPAAFVLFSDVIEDGKSRGEKLAKFIKEQINIGKLNTFGPTINPKTGNTICVYLWELDHEKLRKWYQDELANRIVEE